MRWPWSRRAGGAADRSLHGSDSTRLTRPRPRRRWAGRSCRRSSAPWPHRSPPVTRPVEFPGELSAWRSPAFTDSLSHAVVDTSSGGVIDGDGGGLGQPDEHVRPRTRAHAAAPAAPDRRAAVGPSGRGRSTPPRRPGRRGASGSVAHPGTVGRDAARPPRRRRAARAAVPAPGPATVHLPVEQNESVAPRVRSTRAGASFLGRGRSPDDLGRHRCPVDQVPVDARVERPAPPLGPRPSAARDSGAPRRPRHPDASAAGAPLAASPRRRSAAAHVGPRQRSAVSTGPARAPGATVQRRVGSTVHPAPRARSSAAGAAAPRPVRTDGRPRPGLADHGAAPRATRRTTSPPRRRSSARARPLTSSPSPADASDDPRPWRRPLRRPSSDPARQPSVLIEPPSMSSVPLPLAAVCPRRSSGRPNARRPVRRRRRSSSVVPR